VPIDGSVSSARVLAAAIACLSLALATVGTHAAQAASRRNLPGRQDLESTGPALLAGSASVARVERGEAPTTLHAVAPNDPAWAQEWGLAQVEAPGAWALARTTRRVVVAVVDSGVDPNQPDLQGALVPGADFADDTGSTADQFGHGTMVAGVIAARGDNGKGVAGACWSCLIMPVKVLNANGSGTALDIARGIRFAAEHGANVINMSFVLSAPDGTVEAAITYAEELGVLVVAAAGNSGGAETTYPASYPGVLSVAATDPGDQPYSWSTRGPWVTLAAPGCTISTALGGGIAPFCGTSAAAPLVAGLAALAYSTSWRSTPDIAAALEQTATPLPGIVGSGRVDALRLLQRVS
jgi:thermitase